jgi:hypothetical protein
VCVALKTPSRRLRSPVRPIRSVSAGGATSTARPTTSVAATKSSERCIPSSSSDPIGVPNHDRLRRIDHGVSERHARPGVLVAHIQARFHQPLREELPRLSAMADKVLIRHGEHYPDMLLPLQWEFRGLMTELLDSGPGGDAADQSTRARHARAYPPGEQHSVSARH